jgi:ribosomal protein S27AE
MRQPIAQRFDPCPECGTVMNHDTFEDCYICPKCYVMYYPEDIGRETNREAGVFHIGEDDRAVKADA